MAERIEQVLIVDDEPGFLEQVRSLMAHFAGGTWRIATASSAAEALVAMQEQTFDLVVIDINMPVLDGIQFVGLVHRRFPSVLKVGFTGDPDERRRVACLGAGAELCLEKPRAADGWEGVFKALDGLLKLHPEEGFRGVLRRVSLQDVIQMECLSRNSSVLEVVAGGRQGAIYIEDGQIKHAEHGGWVGLDAFNALMALTGGSFNLKPFSRPPVQSVSGSWEFLLMEAARMRDEAAEGVAVERRGEVPTVPEGNVIADLPGDAASIVAGTMAEPAATVPPAVVEPVASVQPKLVETVICSLQGEVCFQWQCPDERGRLALLEFASQRAKVMNVNLPLGPLERLEFSDHRQRALCRMLGDRALFVRADYSAAANPGSPIGP